VSEIEYLAGSKLVYDEVVTFKLEKLYIRTLIRLIITLSAKYWAGFYNLQGNLF